MRASLLMAAFFLVTSCATCASPSPRAIPYAVTSPMEDAPLRDAAAIAGFRRSCVTILYSSTLPLQSLEGSPPSFNSVGAGVIVRAVKGQKLLILTANHVAVIFDATHPRQGHIRLLSPAGVRTLMDVHIVKQSKEVDLALLESEEVWHGDGDLGVRIAAEEPGRGERVWMVGTPGGSEFNVSNGVISNKGRCMSPKGACYQTDAQMYFGNSGGGVFNTAGELVGIADYVQADRITDKDGDEHFVVLPGTGGVLSLGTVKSFLSDAAG